MGRDKALLELAGRPLVAHAVEKLRRVCADVKVLGSDPALEAYAGLVRDVHEGCGPLGGIEAALADARNDWSLIVPVDVPFVPTAFLDRWVRSTVWRPDARLSMFTVDGFPQPTVLMIHREARPWVERAVEEGRYKLYPVLEAAGRDLADRRGKILGMVFRNLPWDDRAVFSGWDGEGEPGEPWWRLSVAQVRERGRWFANLNTPEEFAEAERHLDALDT